MIKASIFKKIMSNIHTKCRSTATPYLKSDKYRVEVPDKLVGWDSTWKEYSPPEYTDPHTFGQSWADGEIEGGQIKFNEVDGKVNRKSYIRNYQIGEDGRPINPMGRTGIRGRGILGRWGPNHAADPLVTRYHNGKLEFVAIQRKDTGEWALPGGMVDPGELVSTTLKREFTEEALGNVPQEALEKLWSKGIELYKGYVDDHRNTDNSWMETVVTHFHDDEGLLAKVNLQAGDDAVNVRWIEVGSNEPLYASHSMFIKMLKDGDNK